MYECWCSCVYGCVNVYMNVHECMCVSGAEAMTRGALLTLPSLPVPQPFTRDAVQHFSGPPSFKWFTPCPTGAIYFSHPRSLVFSVEKASPSLGASFFSRTWEGPCVSSTWPARVPGETGPASGTLGWSGGDGDRLPSS